MNASIALGTYNPSQVPKEILLAEFTARKPMLEDLLGILRANAPGEPCQHCLLVGPRGFGKTTSLFALKYRLEDDETLSSEWIPLLFDEENYQIADLADFWLECLRLAETAFRVAAGSQYQSLSVSRDPKLEALAQEAFLSLLDQQKRRAVLLIDNINDILAVVADENEQHRLRALLLEESRVCVVGTASTYFEAVANADQPFYNLYRTFRLDRFTPEEMRTALEAMSQARSAGEPAITLPKGAGYWKGLHILTGGNPRLVKMIFQLMEQGVTSDFRAQLEGLLDAYTPYFKHRIEAMSPQQRRVFDAIALAWDPVQVADIAPGLRMESNQISAQIRALMDAQLVSIAAGSPKRRTYQIADRFSNIYYFMRYSRAGRCKFEWFVLTMKAILTPEQFRSQLEHMRTLGLSCASESDMREQTQLIVSATRAIDDPMVRRVEAHKSVALYLDHAQENALRHLLDDPAMHEVLADEHALVRFFSELPREERRRINYLPNDAHWWVRLTDFAESRRLWTLAEIAYRKAIELDPAYSTAWLFLGILLADNLQRYDEAENAFRKAIELEPSDAHIWTCLGNLLKDHLGRVGEAETALRKAVEVDASYAFPWTCLGNLLEDHLEQFAGAEAAFRKSLELDATDAYTWTVLGRLLEDHFHRIDEAEEAFRKAIETNSGYAFAWTSLGSLLWHNSPNRHEEAKFAFRKSVELDPNARSKSRLAYFLFVTRENAFEAADLVADSILLDPDDWFSLFVFREAVLGNIEASTHFLRRLLPVLSENIPFHSKDLTGQTYAISLECIISLLRSNRDQDVLDLIQGPKMGEMFDIPLRAIQLRQNTLDRSTLAGERLALVDAFLEKVAEPAEQMPKNEEKAAAD